MKNEEENQINIKFLKDIIIQTDNKIENIKFNKNIYGILAGGFTLISFNCFSMLVGKPCLFTECLTGIHVFATGVLTDRFLVTRSNEKRLELLKKDAENQINKLKGK
jgi:hypothetical protein